MNLMMNFDELLVAMEYARDELEALQSRVALLQNM